MGSPKPIIYVEIGGKKRPVRFGRAAFAEFSDKANLPADRMPELSTGVTLKQIDALLWAGLWDGARKERQPFEIDVADVQDWIDEMDPKEAADVQAAIMSHLAASQSTNGEAAEGGEKKSRAKKT